MPDLPSTVIKAAIQEANYNPQSRLDGVSEVSGTAGTAVGKKDEAALDPPSQTFSPSD